jgi:hypothetical protein
MLRRKEISKSELRVDEYDPLDVDAEVRMFGKRVSAFEAMGRRVNIDVVV